MRALICTAIAIALSAVAVAPPAVAEQGKPNPLFQQITRHAQDLAKQPYSPPSDQAVPKALRNLNYEQYRDIRFRKDQALWKGQALFNVEFFHLGFLYKTPVTVHQVVDGQVQDVAYDPKMFDFGKNPDLADKANADLGFAGFRIHYPINRPNYKDEVIAFLGASYFRMVGRGQSYGLSARGLAVNTGLPQGEEFPRFTEFWLVRPGPEATSMTFYALLDSKSVTGAYRFVLKPRANTALDVEAHLFARDDVKKLGIAPLTSMYLYGENRVRHFDDYRPEVHDSDGLLEHTGSGQWIWRPLTNPHDLRVTSLMDDNPKGFGLVQRDRDFRDYLDPEARFDQRPSVWIEPGQGWGKGAVQLIEIPANDETDDNIVAFWNPEKPFKAGEQRTFEYRITTFNAERREEDLATARRTLIGWGGIPGSPEKPPRSLRQFIVDFQGGVLSALDGSQPVKAHLSVSKGTAKTLTVERLPGNNGWRAAFKLAPDHDNPADMSLYLTLRGRRVTETWSYVWSPAAIQ